MSTLTELSEGDRYAIIALHKHANWKQERIAAAIKCSQSSVSYTLNRYQEHGTTQDLPRKGSKPIVNISDKENNPITKAIRKRRKSTGKDIKHELEDELDITISVRTILRLRKLLGFRGVHYRRRPILTENGKRKRLYYCLDNLDEDWKEVIFSDESMFVMGDDHKIVYKRPESPPVIKQFDEYPYKVMVWGGIWWQGRTRLCFIEGSVDAKVYQKILSDYLLRDNLDEIGELLQDGARSHTAQSTMEFADAKGIDIRQNPPSSPELNPIEKVWGWMKDRVSNDDPRDKDQLKALIQKYWDEIPQTLIQHYISHNRTVVNEIIQAEGGSIAEPHRHKKKQHT
jgi:transposase